MLAARWAYDHENWVYTNLTYTMGFKVKIIIINESFLI